MVFLSNNVRMYVNEEGAGMSDIEARFGRFKVYDGDGVWDGTFNEVSGLRPLENSSQIPAENLICLPGLVDMHVHLRDPYLVEGLKPEDVKETLESGTLAAMYGGVAGVACMPNTVPPLDNPEIIKEIAGKSVRGELSAKVYPVACITKGMKGRELTDFQALKAAGAVALSDDGRPVESEEIMLTALKKAKEAGLLIISHCEDLKIIAGGIMHKGAVSEMLGVPGMDRASEDISTARDIALAERAGARIHIAHVSTRGSVEIIRAAKKRGVQVTCETAPHYFTLTHEALKGRDADYRMNPPLREESDRTGIIEGILDGTIDCIATDHAPHTPKDKSDFLKAPNGVLGLETSLAAVLTFLIEPMGLDFNWAARLMSVNPRRILGLGAPKLTGFESELTFIAPDKEWVAEPENFKSMSRNSAFKGMKLKGKPVAVVKSGKLEILDREWFLK